MKFILAPTTILVMVLTTTTAQFGGSSMGMGSGLGYNSGFGYGSGSSAGGIAGGRLGGFDALYTGLSSSLSPWRSYLGPMNRYGPYLYSAPTNPYPSYSYRYSRWNGRDFSRGGVPDPRARTLSEDSSGDVEYDDENSYSDNNDNIIDRFFELVAQHNQHADENDVSSSLNGNEHSAENITVDGPVK